MGPDIAQHFRGELMNDYELMIIFGVLVPIFLFVAFMGWVERRDSKKDHELRARLNEVLGGLRDDS